MNSIVLPIPKELSSNQFNNWQETHFEIVDVIVQWLNQPKENIPNVILKVENTQGRAGLYDLAKEWTDEFEQLYKDKEWDGEWLDTIDEFIREKCRDTHN